MKKTILITEHQFENLVNGLLNEQQFDKLINNLLNEEEDKSIIYIFNELKKRYPQIKWDKYKSKVTPFIKNILKSIKKQRPADIKNIELFFKGIVVALKKKFPNLEWQTQEEIKSIIIQLKNKYPKIQWDKETSPGTTYQEILIKADPTKKLLYLPWILKQYNDILEHKITDIKENEFLEDLYKIREYLEFYDKIKHKLEPENRNIFNISTYKNLWDIIKPFMEFKKSPDLNKKEFELIKSGQAERIYEDNKWFVLTPKNVNAACTFSDSTTWCTKHEGQFKNYSSQGPLYIVIDKINKKKKYQFHFATDTWNDEDDRSVGSYVEWFKDKPELLKVFHKFAQKEYKFKFLLSTGFKDWIDYVDPNIIDLSLNNLGVNELDEKIGNLKNLRSFNINNNNLKELPDSIGNLTNLIGFSAQRNKLRHLPESFSNLNKLQEIMVSENNFTEIPSPIGRLESLTRLYLSNNPIKNITPEWRNKITQSQRERIRLEEAERMSFVTDRLKEYYFERENEVACVNHKVTHIEKLNGKQDVYCMEVPGYNWFFANNLLVHNCNFCSVPRQYFRKIRRIPFEQWKQDFDLMNSLYEGKRVETFELNEENTQGYNSSKPYLEHIKSKEMGSHILLRADQMLEGEHVRKLADAGVHRVHVGVESGSPRILEQMNKKCSPAEMLQAAGNMSKHGIYAVYTAIIGNPTETHGEVCMTMDLLDKLFEIHKGNCRATVYTLIPLPGTVSHDQCIAAGWDLPKTTEGWSNWSAANNPAFKLGRNIYWISGLYYNRGSWGKTGRVFGKYRFLIQPFEWLCSWRHKNRFFKFFDFEKFCIEQLVKWASNRAK